jgi:uncharacterized membrane protein
MQSSSFRWPSAVALVASLLGLTFAWLSTQDYARHLDRQMHDIHCSYIPGGVEAAAENPCRVAMFSAYSAVMRDQVWGGIPISLFAVGAFSFFAAFALYGLLAGRTAPRRTAQFLGFAGLTPLLVSVLMGTISALELGQFCKTCVGIYISSALLAVGGIAAYVVERNDLTRSMRESARAAPAGAGAVPPTVVDGELEPSLARRRPGGLGLHAAWLLTLGVFTLTPALLYARAVPSYTSHITGCGTLAQPADKNDSLLHVSAPGAKQPATLFVDPLCPTCKGLHQRLEAEGYLEQLDMRLVLFPLDNECNWMLERPVHPGACVVSKAVLCGGDRALSVLEWAYEEQDHILEVAKGSGGNDAVKDLVVARFPNVKGCLDDDATSQRLDHMLRYIVDNKLPVSTPQVYLDDRRLCSEDSDIGLAFAMRKLAPELR